MEAILKLTNVSKSIGKKNIIKRISFELLPGEVLGFLGPNGAGKTTTIKMIMGFLAVDEGKIEINGFDHKKNYEKAMANIGGIVENPEMYQDLSGLVNLQMYARLHDGVTKERIDEVVRLVGMQDRIKEKVKRYSLGMKQRVGLAQALLHRPKILILDEPTNGLDPAGIHELRDIVKKLAHEENVAVMVSSHLLSEMQMMCDRVAIIDNGNIIDVRSLQDLTAEDHENSSFRITTPDVPKAVELLTASGVNISAQELNSFEITTSDVELQKILSTLITAQITITGLQRTNNSLEDAFLRITGGGINIA
jgi:ABC-2 type transport system ATP-binding protein